MHAEYVHTFNRVQAIFHYFSD